IRGVGKERAGANSRVEVGGCDGLNGKQANGRVECASGETQKGALPFCRIAAGIASVRRRIERLRPRRERKAGERHWNSKRRALAWRGLYPTSNRSSYSFHRCFLFSCGGLFYRSLSRELTFWSPAVSASICICWRVAVT